MQKRGADCASFLHKCNTLIIESIFSADVTIVTSLFESSDAVAAIEALFNKTATAGTEDMAAALLEMAGGDVSYVLNGETRTLTQSELMAALETTKRPSLTEGENVEQSPYALYLYWREMNGFAA